MRSTECLSSCCYLKWSKLIVGLWLWVHVTAVMRHCCVCSWCFVRCVRVDIDECAPGGKAESCNEHGVCDGLRPAGNWTCACEAGYELLPNRTACKRQYCCCCCVFCPITNRTVPSVCWCVGLLVRVRIRWLKQLWVDLDHIFQVDSPLASDNSPIDFQLPAQE